LLSEAEVLSLCMENGIKIFGLEFKGNALMPGINFQQIVMQTEGDHLVVENVQDLSADLENFLDNLRGASSLPVQHSFRKVS